VPPAEETVTLRPLPPHNLLSRSDDEKRAKTLADPSTMRLIKVSLDDVDMEQELLV
jgi:hypothetical protein